MLRYLKYACVLSTVTLTGCAHIYGHDGIIQNRDTDYLYSEQIPPLRIPPGMSSSTIQAHYPVSEKQFPECSKKIDLLPPELPSATNAAKVITPAPTHLTQYDENTDATSQVGVGHSRSQIQEPVTPAQQKQATSHYYDPYTRSATGGVGKPIRDAATAITPNLKKSAAQHPATDINGDRVSGVPTPTPGNMSSNNSAVSAPAPQTAANAPAGTSLRTIINKVWPWGKQTTASSEKPTEKSEPKQVEANNTANSASKMYYDRYTRR